MAPRPHFSGRRPPDVLGTLFLRNRPALELMRRLFVERPQGSSVRVAVLGCSVGVEVYSIVWTLRRARPDLTILIDAVDISPEVLAIAEEGVYGPQTAETVHESVFERLTEAELLEMFDWNGDQGRVKPWLREGITWRLGDAADPRLVDELGSKDSWLRTTSSATWMRRVPNGACGTSYSSRAQMGISSYRASTSTSVRRSRSTSAGSRSRS